MFCTACGNPIVPQQAVCSKCGAATSMGVMQGSVRRVSEHYRLLGILMIVYSALISFGGFFVLMMSHVLFPRVFIHATPPPPDFVVELIPRIVAIVGWAILIKGVAGLVAGIGMLNRAPWARTLMLVVAFLSLLSFPFGTAIGIYAIWVLLSAGAEREYNELALAAR